MLRVTFVSVCLWCFALGCSSTDVGGGDVPSVSDVTDAVQVSDVVTDGGASTDSTVIDIGNPDVGADAENSDTLVEDISFEDVKIDDVPGLEDAAVGDTAVTQDAEEAAEIVEDVSVIDTLPADGTEDWLQMFGGAGSEEVKAVAADSVGNVYVAGIYQKTLVVGDQTFEPSEPGKDTPDVFVASFDPKGAFRWAHAFGTTGPDIAFEIMVDGKDDVYVAGSHQKDLIVGGETLLTHGSTDVFVVSYDMNGNQLWAKNWGGPFGETPRSLYVNSKGDVFVTGSFQGLIQADGLEVESKIEYALTEIFVLAIDGQTHDAMWLKCFGGNGHDTGTAIVADPDRNVVVALSFQHELIVDEGIVFTGAGLNFNVGLVRLDKEGEVMWANEFGGTGAEEFIGLGLDDKSNAYVTGVFSETAGFGGADLVSGGGHDIVLASYDANGMHLWSRAFSGPSFDQALDLEVQGEGIYVTGRFKEGLDFGSASFTSTANGYDVFVGHFSTQDGEPVWVQTLGGDADEQGNGIGVGGDGGIFVGGYAKGPVDFAADTVSLPSGGLTDAFVLRFIE
jgi:hypothetical protein